MATNLSFCICDETGNGSEAKRLFALVANKSMVGRSSTDIPSNITESVVIFHRNDYIASISSLEILATSGKTIIAYGRGEITTEWKNRIYYCHLSEVERLLKGMLKTWGKNEFLDSLGNPAPLIDKEHGFVAMAILAQCASTTLSRGEVLKKREAWRTNPTKWNQIFAAAPLIQMRESAVDGSKDHVTKLIDWIELKGGNPEFAKAAKEAADLAR